jgi:uncharacterized protein YcaQ
MVVARSQDIFLHSRVVDYNPEYLYNIAYDDRELFDYGGALFVYPISDLPYFRYHMKKRAKDEYVKYHVPEYKEVLKHVRAELRKNGPLGNRDFGGKRVAGWSYRGRKQTSVALFDMWLSGEVMIHHREGFERVYDFRKNIAPREFEYIAKKKDVEEFFARKAVSFVGLMRETRLRVNLDYDMRHKYDRDAVDKKTGRWIESGMFMRAQVESGRDTYLVLSDDVKALESLEKGKVPRGWTPKETTTLEEVTFLAPLDIVSARGRAKKVFDFDYIWEVYKPVEKRRWGYYVLPILYGDELVARLDPKLDRTTMTLQVKGFWLEDDAPVEDVAFADALSKGLVRFAKFLDAKKVDISVIKPVRLRKHVQDKLKSLL